jgi:hypothetical protein
VARELIDAAGTRARVISLGSEHSFSLEVHDRRALGHMIGLTFEWSVPGGRDPEHATRDVPDCLFHVAAQTALLVPSHLGYAVAPSGWGAKIKSALARLEVPGWTRGPHEQAEPWVAARLDCDSLDDTETYRVRIRWERAELLVTSSPSGAGPDRFRGTLSIRTDGSPARTQLDLAPADPLAGVLERIRDFDADAERAHRSRAGWIGDFADALMRGD